MTGQGHRQRAKKKCSPLKPQNEARPTIFSRRQTHRQAEILSFPPRVRPPLNSYPIMFIHSLGGTKKKRVLQGTVVLHTQYAARVTIGCAMCGDGVVVFHDGSVIGGATFRTCRPLSRCSGFKGTSSRGRPNCLCSATAHSYSISVISAKGSLTLLSSAEEAFQLFAFSDVEDAYQSLASLSSSGFLRISANCLGLGMPPVRLFFVGNAAFVQFNCSCRCWVLPSGMLSCSCV